MFTSPIQGIGSSVDAGWSLALGSAFASSGRRRKIANTTAAAPSNPRAINARNSPGSGWPLGRIGPAPPTSGDPPHVGLAPATPTAAGIEGAGGDDGAGVTVTVEAGFGPGARVGVADGRLVGFGVAWVAGFGVGVGFAAGVGAGVAAGVGATVGAGVGGAVGAGVAAGVGAGVGGAGVGFLSRPGGDLFGLPAYTSATPVN